MKRNINFPVRKPFLSTPEVTGNPDLSLLKYEPG